MRDSALPATQPPTVARQARPGRGLTEAGQRRAFLLPAVLLALAFVIFPTVFGIYVSFTDWQLNDPAGRVFNGLQNFQRIASDDRFWNALKNNFMFVLIGVPFQYVLAFGLALLLNQEIRGRKFFRVVFLLPFMMSPVAAGWMIGRSIMDAQRGPLPSFLRDLGFSDVSFFSDGIRALFSLTLIDSWYSIPFMLVLLLAGLQALPPEVMEAAKIDGAGTWQSFRDMTFPLLLPVSLTAIVLRAVFEFKIIDIILVVTGGGPGNATETLTTYIYRRGVQNIDVGYATAMSQLFLIAVIITIVSVIVVVGRKVRDVA
ncbi:MAG: sugar ABC transporter permease [Chloroflexota bacterium]|nr:sugar ABC transporter permease [Chloroflexota bacterium]